MSQIALSALLFTRHRRSMTLPEWLFLAFLGTVAAYLLYPFTHGHWLEPIQKAVENFLPGIFWLFCSSVFNDRFRIKLWHICLVCFTVFLPLIGILMSWQNAEALTIMFFHIPQVLEFVLLTLALIEVVRHWNDDLIESRRTLRLWFCTMIGLYIIGTIALREVIMPSSNWLSFWQYVPVGLILLFTNLILVQYRPALLNVIDRSAANRVESTEPPKSDTESGKEAEVEVPPEVVNQLDKLMTEQFVYRKMGLTIGQLAEQLELPEYRLRRIINAGLGFRNFNDYLNGFRIKEAGQRLADPAQNGEAVLNIALDTGFRSLSSFNKAFRESFGVTPTAYRQQQTKLHTQ